MPKSDTPPYSVNQILNTRGGDWRLTEELGAGHGSSAWVFKAVDTEDANRLCALKIFKPWVSEDPDAHQEALTRLDRQLLLREHDCPYLIRILEAGTLPDGPELYLAMEYIPGSNLEHLRGRVPLDRVRPLISQIATAVKYLRAGEVFHRDIKPANVIVSPGYRKATLADLGVAVQVSSERSATQAKEFLGTSRYSPPEFISDPSIRDLESIDAINYYQLGAILYELITRRQLFYDVPTIGLAEAIRNTIPPLDVADLVDPDLADLADFARCALSKDPESRRSLSYESFIFAQDPIEPVILFLHAGGTVSSATDSHERAARVVANQDSLLSGYTQRIKQDYKFFHPEHKDIPFSIEWTTMPPEHQILSENASIEYWNALSLEIARMIDTHRHQYVLGVVVLHGTDTMAYSCAALTFSLSRLPCPVVLTGSNLPPLEKSLFERDPVVGTSDVWRNLLGTVRFLETFGHRHPEVWLSFADTVLLAVNVRKTVEPSLVGSDSLADVAAVLGEPFTFRRPEPHPRYDFKAIDGVYVNNFYPTPRGKDYRELIAIDSSEYRHRRVVFGSKELVERSELRGEVIVWSVSPAATLALVRDKDRDKKRVLIIDGYSSGTFPNTEGHPAVETLRTTIALGVPVVVVSGDGLLPSGEQYHVEKIDGKTLNVLRLYGIVKESAVPLIHRVLTDIPLERWKTNGSSGERCELIREQLDTYFRTHESVANLLLGSITDPAELRNDLVARLQYRFSSGAGLLRQLLAGNDGADEWSQGVWAVSEKLRSGNSHIENLAIIPRRLLIFLIAQSLRLHDVAGAGPDAMEVACELGYQIGRSLLKGEEFLAGRRSTALLYDLDEVDRQRALRTSKYFIRRVVGFIRRSGFADIRVDRITLPLPRARKSLLAIGKPPGFVGFRLRVRKYGLLTREDELYSVHAATEADRGFFGILAQGVPPTMKKDEFDLDVEVALNKLYTATWGLKLSVLDWALVGMGKAIAVGVSSYLNVDRWVESWTARGGKHLAALRSSVGIEIAAGSDVELVVSYRYSPRLTVTTDGRVEPPKDLPTTLV